MWAVKENSARRGMEPQRSRTMRAEEPDHESGAGGGSGGSAGSRANWSP